MKSTAEPPINPPSPTEAEYARNIRNYLRDEINDAIDRIDSRLNELDPEGYPSLVWRLTEIRESMRRDYEY